MLKYSNSKVGIQHTAVSSQTIHPGNGVSVDETSTEKMCSHLRYDRFWFFI